MSKNLDERFSENLMLSQIEGLHDKLEGINYTRKFEEGHIGATKEQEDYIIKFCNMFEEKFGKKLTYRFDGLYWLKYAEENPKQ